MHTPALIDNDMHTVRRSMRDNVRKGVLLLSAFIYTEQYVAENLRHRGSTTTATRTTTTIALAQGYDHYTTTTTTISSNKKDKFPVSKHHNIKTSMGVGCQAFVISALTN